MSTEAVLVHPTDALSKAGGPLFFGALALATILPLALLPLSNVLLPTGPNELLLGLWVVTGFGHVMCTVWFGLDADYLPIIGAHRGRMIASLVILPLGMVAIALALPGLLNWVLAAYWAWQAHHYNRQNYGVLAFAAAHDRTGPLPREISWLLHLSTGAGALILASMPTIYGLAAPPSPIGNVDIAIWRGIAIALLTGAAGLAIYLVATNARVRSSPTVLLFLFLSVVFYVPGIASDNPIAAFWPYAMAHGAQYLIIMGVTAGRSRRGLAGLIIFIVLTFVLGAIAYSMVTLPWAALYTGIVSWHFLVDARMWRLRDPAVRAIARQRFAFVFGGQDTRVPTPRALARR